MSDLMFRPATELAELVRSGEHDVAVGSRFAAEGGNGFSRERTLEDFRRTATLEVQAFLASCQGAGSICRRSI